MKHVVIAVDIGTTATKVVAFDARGAERGATTIGYPLLEPLPGQAVQDPDVIASAVVDAVRSTVGHVRSTGGRVRGLAFSSAMHSLIGIDSKGRPVTPSITWADTRAREVAERLRASASALALHRRTGTPVHPMSPLVKLAWFRENDEDAVAKTARWVGIKEYVVARLTGEWIVDHSVASAAGLLNLSTLDWDPEALALAGVDRSQLSSLVPSTYVVPALTTAAAGELGLDPATPLVVGASDGPLANLGVGAVRPGMAACSIGTSGAMRVMVDRPAVDPDGSVFCYALAPGRWAVGGAINNGGVVLQWAREALAPDAGGPADLLDLAARAPAGSGGLVMLPYLLGERAPRWSSAPRGAYVGLTRAHGREHLVRAALEGVCLQLALVLRSMRAAGVEVREMRATGGFARSPLWRQMLTDALGMDIGFPVAAEGSSFGAAMLGMQALGMIESIDVAADLVRIEEVRRPDPGAAERYAELLPIFAELYDALTPAFHALGALDRRLGKEP